MIGRELRPAPIAVPQEVLDDLSERLARTRWPDAVPGTGWEAGADVESIRRLCAYWRNEYDWRVHEADLNRHPLFLCEVDGLDLHFWWVRGQGPQPLPLLLVHGWPGSIAEFRNLIGPLTDPASFGGDAGDSFDIVIPSLPGYGFGGHPRERGWGGTRCAAAFQTLMTQRLGYSRYGTQGGDWGALITSKLASMHPESVLGIHLNFAIPNALIDLDRAERSGSPDERRVAAVRKAFARDESGYSALQATKPMSLGIAQADSPAGLAAWIVEKVRAWSDWDDDFESLFSRDALLTNIMFYWAPNSIASAARLYYEWRSDTAAQIYSRVKVPTAMAVFPKEILPVVRSWIEERYALHRWTEMPRGGHFPAHEQPELLLEDVRAFYRDLR